MTQQIATCQLKLHKKPPLPTIALAIFCAVVVIFIRFSPSDSFLRVGGTVIPYTDFFVLMAAGIGGLACGLAAFVLLFIGEFLRVSGDVSLYSVSTYLILVLIAARLSYCGWFRGWKKIGLSFLLLTSSLALCWFLTFTAVIPREEVRIAFTDAPYWRLFLWAAPETALAVAVIALFFRYAPDDVKLSVGSGWVYTPDHQEEGRRWQIMAIRITAFSLAEAALLCLTAIFCTNLYAASEAGEPFGLPYMLSLWRQNLRLALMIMCTAIPMAYLFNMSVMRYIVYPINAMSFLMERYFSVSEEERARALPNLDIRTGDELERLYQSLQKMVEDMGVYIDRALEQERKSARLTKEFMLALAKAVDAKDHYTSGHSVRVAKYAQEIARRMGKSPKEQEEIYTMGLLHDIGKIGVPETIINKSGKLTEEEFAKIKEHPAMGHAILRYVRELPKLATGARWHHERYDGRGYPDGLSGENIPEEARIICVADAYDALTSNRAYSKIRPQGEVRAEILRCRGTQFDPQFADIMISMIDDDPEYKMREHSADGGEKTAE